MEINLKSVGVFGTDIPWAVLETAGIRARDITYLQAHEAPGIEAFVEPFMDAFSKSVLRNLSSGLFNALDAIIFLRESPGAVYAFQHACELRRRGLVPKDAPDLILLNLVMSESAPAMAFNRTEIARVRAMLPGRCDPWNAPQPDVPPPGVGDRIALFGPPLGNDRLQSALRGFGALVLDQSRLLVDWSRRGADLDTALRNYANNPFAGRQPQPIFANAILAELRAMKVRRVYWQVDPTDDLWGWVMPDLRDLCTTLGIGFVDLGFVPRWPTEGDIATLALGERL